MSQIRYLLDEHVNPRLKRALKNAIPELEVLVVGDLGTPPLQSLDPDILIWCEANAFSLVTNNRKSMPVHLQDHIHQGHHVPAIFVMSSAMTFGDLVDELMLIWRVCAAEEFWDQLLYLPLS